jgi:lipoate-protein ligase A
MTRGQSFGPTARGDGDDLVIPPYHLDDDLIADARADGRSRVRVLTVAEPMVVLGRGSDPREELHVDACRDDGVVLVRRKGGGCAVVLDPGNVVVSVALAIGGLGRIRSTFDGLTDWFIAGLARIGVPGVIREGTSDLALDGRKISGSCVFRSLGIFYYSATLLVAPDLDLVERYLAHPPREPDYRRGRAHRDFMAGIGPVLRRDVGEIADDLRRELPAPPS